MSSIIEKPLIPKTDALLHGISQRGRGTIVRFALNS